jgi:Penicillinase repressor
MKHGRCSARDIEQEMPDAPTYSAVRSVLRSLTDKGLLLKETIESRDWFVLPVPANHENQ